HIRHDVANSHDDPHSSSLQAQCTIRLLKECRKMPGRSGFPRAPDRPPRVRERARTGFVKDAQGSVVPGVAVKAASPVLIEKVRTALTDGTGAISFRSPATGGHPVDGNWCHDVDADIRVVTVPETVTVTGETPSVDVQTFRVRFTCKRGF